MTVSALPGRPLAGGPEPVAPRAEPAVRRQRRWRPGRGGQPASPLHYACLLLALATATIIVGLLAYVVVLSFRRFNVNTGATATGAGNYPYVYRDAALLTALRNTAEFAGLTLVVALALGLTLAWLVERTTLPGKTLVRSFVTMGMVIPGFFYGIAYLLLFDDQSGIVNVWLQHHLGFTTGPIDVQTLYGMGIVQGLALAPLVFIMTSATLGAINPELEEAAELSGAGRWTVLRRVTLPLAYPGILGAAIFVLVISISAFDIPLFIGVRNHIETFTTYVFYLFSASTSAQVGTELAATASISILVLATGLALWYARTLARERRFQVVAGRGYRARQVHLGRWSYPVWAGVGGYMAGGLVLTLLVTVWAAFHSTSHLLPSFSAIRDSTLANFRALFSPSIWSNVRPAIWHTVVVTLVVPSIALVLSVAFSIVVLRSPWRWRRRLDLVAFVPQAVPGVIFGFAAFASAVNLSKSSFYASLTWLVLVMAVVYLGFGTRITNSALIQLHPELEEAARMSGANSFVTLRRVLLPLIRPTLVAGWLWMALLAFRELTLTLFLSQPGQATVSVRIFYMYTISQNDLGVPAALTVLMLVVLLPLIPVYWRVNRRTWSTG